MASESSGDFDFDAWAIQEELEPDVVEKLKSQRFTTRRKLILLCNNSEALEKKLNLEFGDQLHLKDAVDRFDPTYSASVRGGTIPSTEGRHSEGFHTYHYRVRDAPTEENDYLQPIEPEYDKISLRSEHPTNDEELSRQDHDVGRHSSTTRFMQGVNLSSITNPNVMFARPLPTPESSRLHELPKGKEDSSQCASDKPVVVGRKIESLIKQLKFKHLCPKKLSLTTILLKSEIDTIPQGAETIGHKIAMQVLHRLLLTDSGARLNYCTKTDEIQLKTRKEISPSASELFLALYLCCDLRVRQLLVQKMFFCRVAMPLVHIDHTTRRNHLVLSTWAWSGIVLGWTDSNGMAQKRSLFGGQTFHLIGFIRFEYPDIVTETLLNDLLEQEIFHVDDPKTLSKGSISDGLIEGSFYLPTGNTEHDLLTKPSLFCTLRGNALDHPKEASLLARMSSFLFIMVDGNDLTNQVKFLSMQRFVQFQMTKQFAFILLVGSDCNSESIIKQNFKNREVFVINNRYHSHRTHLGDTREHFRRVLKGVLGDKNEKSMETLKEITAGGDFLLDELDKKCKTGRKNALDIISVLGNAAMKIKDFPLQMFCSKISTLERTRREMRKDLTLQDSNSQITSSEMRKKLIHIKEEILALREEQVGQLINMNACMAKFADIYINYGKDEMLHFFTTRYLQMHLDDAKRSRIHPLLHKHRDIIENRNTYPEQEYTTMLEQIEEEKKDVSLGLEHIQREMGQVIETYNFYKSLDQPPTVVPSKVKNIVKKMPHLAAHMLTTGFPLEIMDGDAGNVSVNWITAVLAKVESIYKATHKKIFVLSTLGVQSTGKSTLLNAMFGTEFATSAGRCTKGLHLQIIPVSNLPFDYVFVVDTEGICAVDIQDHSHDNKIATLAVGLGDATIVNISGENCQQMVEVLPTVVHAFLRIKLVDDRLDLRKKRCFFVHHNTHNASNETYWQNIDLGKYLDGKTSKVAKLERREDITKFRDVIEFDSRTDAFNFPTLWNGTPPMATINKDYTAEALKLRARVFTKTPKDVCFTVTKFARFIRDLWNAMQSTHFVLRFRNTDELLTYHSIEVSLIKVTKNVEKEVRKGLDNIIICKIKNTKDAHDLDRIFPEANGELQQLCTKCSKYGLDSIRNIAKDKSFADDEKNEMEKSFRASMEAVRKGAEENLLKAKGRRKETFDKKTSPDTEARILKQAMEYASDTKATSEAERDKMFDVYFRRWSEPFLTKPTSSGYKTFSTFVVDTLLKIHPSLDRSLLDQTLEKCNFGKDVLAKKSNRENIALAETSEKQMLKDGLVVIHRQDGKLSDEELVRKIRDDILWRVDRYICRIKKTFRVLKEDYIERIVHIIERGVERQNRKRIAHLKRGFTVTLIVEASRGSICQFFYMQNRVAEIFIEKDVFKFRKEYYNKAFNLFKSILNRESAEEQAATLFVDCIAVRIHNHLDAYLQGDLVFLVFPEIASKRDLLLQLLETLIKKKDPILYEEYLHDPQLSAKTYIKERLEKRESVKGKKGKSVYKKIALSELNSIYECAKHAVEEAIKKPSTLYEWIRHFSDYFGKTVTIDHGIFEYFLGHYGTISISKRFGAMVERKLKEFKENTRRKFENHLPAMSWEVESQCDSFLDKLWGCEEVCPLCKEPCVFSVKDHVGPDRRSKHRCIQHRVLGLVANLDLNGYLNEGDLNTCSTKVASGEKLPLEAIKGNISKQKDGVSVKEYKEYFPDWDLDYDDDDGNSSNFWKRFIGIYGSQFDIQGEPQWANISEEAVRADMRLEAELFSDDTADMPSSTQL